ncbi:MAG: Histone acetyltransferase HPA2-related acetyltransferase [Firmicutes bacterium]|nr:Histone acetyltransferase HPA2-related acetyltransferase [Bacillota bacterium]
MNLHFEDMGVDEEVKIADFFWQVFAEFDCLGYGEVGVNEFKNFILPENIRGRCATGKFSMLCCKDDAELVGVISMRNNQHVSLLFVKKTYHKLGIASSLFKLARERCLMKIPHLRCITVNSSPYAIGFYEKIGFTVSRPEQHLYGISFIPMQITLNSDLNSTK